MDGPAGDCGSGLKQCFAGGDVKRAEIVAAEGHVGDRVLRDRQAAEQFAVGGG